MKKTLLTFIVALSVSSLSAQGIQFNHWEETSWEEVLKEAKESKSLVYVDVYTDWCGPCKRMAAEYFPTQQAQEAYSSFIAYKLDAEKGQGPELAKKYKVRGYPTNLFIDPNNEEVVYERVGMPSSLEAFNTNASNALLEFNDPMQLEDYQNKYKNDQSESFTKSYLEKLGRLDKDNNSVLNDYVKSYMRNGLSKNALPFLLKHTKNMGGSAMALLLKNKSLVNTTIMKKGNGQDLSDFVLKNAAGSIMQAAKTKDLGAFTKIKGAVQNALGADASILPLYQLTNYWHQMTRNGDMLKETSRTFANAISKKESDFFEARNNEQLTKLKYKIEKEVEGTPMPPKNRLDVLQNKMNAPEVGLAGYNSYASELNRLAWGVFEQNKTDIKDEAMVKEAISWAAKGMELSKKNPMLNPMIADTYANLLYIDGSKTKAVSILEKLVRTLDETHMMDSAEYKKTLEQMKKGL